MHTIIVVGLIVAWLALTLFVLFKAAPTQKALPLADALSRAVTSGVFNPLTFLSSESRYSPRRQAAQGIVHLIELLNYCNTATPEAQLSEYVSRMTTKQIEALFATLDALSLVTEDTLMSALSAVAAQNHPAVEEWKNNPKRQQIYSLVASLTGTIVPPPPQQPADTFVMPPSAVVN